MNQNGQIFKKEGAATSLKIIQTNLHSHKMQPMVNYSSSGTNYPPRLSGPNIIVNKPITVQQLNEVKYVHSAYNHRPQVHINYGQNSLHSNFNPPPPQRFLLSNGPNVSGNTQPIQLPIQSNHIKTSQIIQPIYQNISKTFIPHHIYNQIPFINSETKVYHQNDYQQQQSASNQQIHEQGEYEDADERMLEQYEKLYQTFIEQKQKNERLERRITQITHQLRRQDQNNSQQVKEVTKQVYVNLPTKIDTKQLISIITKKFKPIINQTFQKKKASCLNKLKNLLNEHQLSIKNTVIRSTQELTVRVRSN